MRRITDCVKERIDLGRGPYRLCWIALGSNMGNREEFLKGARQALELNSDIQILKQSCILETKPILFENQPDFLNQILEIRTALPPEELLDFLKATEKHLGRQDRFRYGPREIDLDILSMEDILIRNTELTIPHPGLLERPFWEELLKDLGQSAENLLTVSGSAK